MVRLLFFALIYLTLLTGCKHESFTNKLDELALICGEPADSSYNDGFLIRLKNRDEKFGKEDIQIFSKSKEGALRSVNFTFTRKACIYFRSKHELDSASYISIVVKNRLAGFVDHFLTKDNLKYLELTSCGDFCKAYPECREIKTPKIFQGKSGNAFKIDSDSPEIVGFVEGSGYLNTLEINEDNCFMLPADSAGTLKIQDVSGNFIEKQSADVIRLESGRGVSHLKMRDPLTIEERSCKENPKFYRMDGNKCVPKSFKDICKESPENLGVAILSTYYLDANCDKIDWSLQGKASIKFAGKSLTNIEIFSGLDNLRELDLSSNNVANFSSLIGVPNLESLTLNSNRFPIDISTIGNLTGLKKMSSLRSKLVNFDKMPILNNLKELQIDSENNQIFDKVPNLEKLSINSGSAFDLSHISSLKYLLSLELTGNSYNHLEALEQLSNLKELKISSKQFSGIEPFPNLRNLESLNVDGVAIENLKNLSFMKNVKSFTYHLEGLIDLSNFPVMEGVRVLDIFPVNQKDAIWLNVFPNLEVLNSTLSEISFAKVPTLVHLQEIHTGKSTDLIGLAKLPRLEILDIEANTEELSTTMFPSLTNLYELKIRRTDQDTQLDLGWLKNLPRLKNISLDFGPINLASANGIPRGVEILSLTTTTLDDFAFLRALPNLFDLSLSIGGTPLAATNNFDLPQIKKIYLELSSGQYANLPNFSGCSDVSIANSGEETESFGTVHNKFPHAKILWYSGSEASANLLADFPGLEELTFAVDAQDLKKLPKLDSLKKLILKDKILESIDGIEQVKNLEILTFESLGLTIPSLGGLSNLSKLTSIENYRERRSKFPTSIECPDGLGVPTGLRNYCLDTQLSFLPLFGPSPF